MRMPDTIGVGLIGYRFMGKAHSHAYRAAMRFFDLPLMPDLRVICGRDAAGVAAMAARWGWAEPATDWHAVVERPDVGLVDISAPGATHAPVAIAAASAGKHILCEKPLANSVAEARAMVQAAEAAGIIHMVGFNYRRVPAVTFARQIIDEGRLGDIRHFRVAYLQGRQVDPQAPHTWRHDVAQAGMGALGDLGAHALDLALYLVGPLAAVCGDVRTFIPERPRADGRGYEPVTVDDAGLALLRFANGAIGTFEVTRQATGRLNSLRFEISGSAGAVAFDLERLNELEFFDRNDPPHLQGWRMISVTGALHPYLPAWWPAGHIIGYEHTFVHEVVDLLTSISRRVPAVPSFVDGLRVQEALEAIARSAREERWVPLAEVE
jgi:predicted dehydrogenase